MKYRNMGRTGLKVSEICVGTMTFGRSTDQSEASKMVSLSLDLGVNFFDTADGYSDGESEIILGKAIKGKRRDAVIATKFFNPMGPGPNDSGMSRVHIMNAVEDSLRRLDSDHIDIYYIHHVDSQTPLEEMLRAVDDLVHQGKVRYIACSNYQAWRLSEAIWISETNDLSRFECYQPQYSLVVRDIEQELIPLCEHKGLGVVVWGPMAGGFLTGKYKPGDRSHPGTRSEENWVFPSQYFSANADDTLATLLSESKRINLTPAQIALRWVLNRPAITSVIVGARNTAQLEENLAAGDVVLDDETLRTLTEVSRLPDRYPESMEKNMHERRDNAVKIRGRT